MLSEITATVILNVESGAKLSQKKKPLRTGHRGVNMKSPVMWISATLTPYHLLHRLRYRRKNYVVISHGISRDGSNNICITEFVFRFSMRFLRAMRLQLILNALYILLIE